MVRAASYVVSLFVTSLATCFPFYILNIYHPIFLILLTFLNTAIIISLQAAKRTAGAKGKKFELTEEQKQEIREAFDLFDTDGSGMHIYASLL